MNASALRRSARMPCSRTNATLRSASTVGTVCVVTASEFEPQHVPLQVTGEQTDSDFKDLTYNYAVRCCTPCWVLDDAALMSMWTRAWMRSSKARSCLCPSGDNTCVAHDGDPPRVPSAPYSAIRSFRWVDKNADVMLNARLYANTMLKCHRA